MLYYERSHVYSAQEVELANAIAHHLASVTARFAAFSKLEETIRYNDLFAGVLAHDLRNPLGAMMTAAQIVLMRKEGEGDRNAKPVSRIISSGQRMMRMIDQLLDVTRARVWRRHPGGGPPHQPHGPLQSGDWRSRVGLSAWTIRRDFAGELDGEWDPDRLHQIVSNLVSNAGQHGRPEGEVSIGLDGRDPDIVTLRVENGGAIDRVGSTDALRSLPRLFTATSGCFPRTRSGSLHRQGDRAGPWRNGRGIVVRRPRDDVRGPPAPPRERVGGVGRMSFGPASVRWRFETIASSDLGTPSLSSCDLRRAG